MARSRNIKPGFFLNEELVELPFETRLLFIGLWTLVDREGRMEYRPKKIKMAIFPADDVDIELALSQLHDAGLIVCYRGQQDTSTGLAPDSVKPQYIQVVNFLKHQNPHKREAASTVPAPGEPEPAPDKHSASPADSLLLNPDSLLLNPDSLSVDSGAAAPQHTPIGLKSCFVPPDWQPEPILPGQVRMDPGVDIDHELAMFRLHEFAQPKSNWQSAWLKWLSRAKPIRSSGESVKHSKNVESTLSAVKSFVDGDCHG